ncbi:MAG: ATP-binding protein [Bacteroidota bacterium]
MKKKLKNPFLLTGYYDKAYFCDREKEIKTLMEHFDNERNVVLYSWRRMGKTALIRCFLGMLEKEKKAETVDVDLLGTRDISSALKQITRAVYHRFGKTSSGMSEAFRKLLGKTGVELSFDPATGMPSFSIGIRNQGIADKSLEAIGSFLDKRKKQIIIALDEFQQVTDYSDQNGEAVFRSWMQSFPGIRFIFSGSHRNMMISMFSEKNRPFYRSAQLLHLDPIDLWMYEKFIRNHFKDNNKIIDNKIIEVIYTWSRKQTYCVQLICNKLFGLYNEVKPEYLQQVYSDILAQESPVFSGYTKLLTDMQWAVMLAIAKEEPLSNPTSKEFIARHHLGASSSVDTALKKLEKSELVIKDDGAYYIHDVLLARWLQSL